MIQGTKQAAVDRFGPVGFLRGGCKRERRGAASHRVVGALVGLAR